MAKNDDKRPTIDAPLSPCSPPSHPTTLGEVWTGITRPSPLALSPAGMALPAQNSSKKSRDD